MAKVKLTDRKKSHVNVKTNGVCAHCGKPLNQHNRTVDHFIPLSFYGTSHDYNLMPVCRQCNIDKGSVIVNPMDYYIYATGRAVEDCYFYFNIWCDYIRQYVVEAEAYIDFVGGILYPQTYGNNYN